MSKHIHNMIPYKRVNRIVLSKCICGKGKTDMIKKFTPDSAETIDNYIAHLNEKVNGQTKKAQ